MIDDNLIATLDIVTLKKYCLWIIFKYLEDSFHQQQNSSRGDLIGGFFDRWINKIPENLIFKKLLKKYGIDDKYAVVNDNFFYSNESAKNAPDILGLIDKDGEVYKFATFKQNKWETDLNAPFIEMKTFRSTQKLITVPFTQYKKDRYFVFVESHIDELYLLNLFEEEFFKNENYFSFFIDDSFVSQNDYNILKNPKVVMDKEKLRKYCSATDSNEDIGYYELLGIFTKDFLDDYSVVVGKNCDERNQCSSEKPRYLDSVKEFDYEDALSVSSGEFFYYYKKLAIPVFMSIDEDSNVHIIYKDELSIALKVDGNANIRSEIDIGEESYCFNKELNDGFFVLKFNYSIRDFIRYYYLEDIVKEVNIIGNMEFKLQNGILNFYGDDFSNNIMDIDLSVDSEFYFTENLKGSCRFYIGCDSNLNYFKRNEEKSERILKGFHKINFNASNGNKYTFKSIEDCNDEVILSLTDKDENFLKLNISLNPKCSKLKFIRLNKSSFQFKVNGNVKINDIEYETGFYGCKIGKNQGVYCIKELHKFDSDPILNGKNLVNFSDSFYYHQENNDENNVPVKITLSENSTLSFFDIKKGSVLVKIDGNGYIDDFPINDEGGGIWKLFFKKFDRSSKKQEAILSKGAIKSSEKSFEKELINDFNDFIKNYSSNDE